MSNRSVSDPAATTLLVNKLLPYSPYQIVKYVAENMESVRAAATNVDFINITAAQVRADRDIVVAARDQIVPIQSQILALMDDVTIDAEKASQARDQAEDYAYMLSTTSLGYYYTSLAEGAAASAEGEAYFVIDAESRAYWGIRQDGIGVKTAELITVAIGGASVLEAKGYRDQAAASATAAAASATQFAEDIEQLTEDVADAASASGLVSTATGGGVDLLSRVTYPCSNRTELKLIDTTRYKTAILHEGTRSGVFVYRTGNFASLAAMDTQEAVFITALGISTSVGCWVRQYGELRVEFFGTAGDGTTDDAAPLQAALTFSKTTGQEIVFDAKTYLTTKSLNATKANQSDGYAVRMRGQGRNNTFIIGNLSEAYPVLDYSNNKRGTIKSLAVRTSTTSLDTCTLFLGESFATGVNLVNIEGSQFFNQSLNAKAAVIGYCCDQVTLTDSECIAVGPASQYGCFFDGANALGASSKYITVAAFGGDLTLFSARSTNFICAGGPGIGIVNITGIEHLDCYYASLNFTDGSAATAAYMVDFYGQNRAISPQCINCRSENQSTLNVNTDVFNIRGSMQNALFQGIFRAGSGGYLMTSSDGTGALYRSEIRAGLSYGVFRAMGALVNTKVSIHDGNNVFGTLTSAGLLASKNLTLTGRVGTFSTIMSIVGTVPGLNIVGVASDDLVAGATTGRSTVERMLFPHESSPVNYRPRAKGPAGLITPVAYTTGSLAIVASQVIPIALLAHPSVVTGNSAMVYPCIEVEFLAQMNSSFAASGQIGLVAVQGATSVSLGTISAVPAGAGGIKARAVIYFTGSTGVINAMADIETTPSGGGSPLRLVSRSGLTGITIAAGTDITIGLRLNNSAASIDYCYGSIKA